MFENVINFFKGLGKNKDESKSKGVAKERLHLVLMQDRANISADFLALMKQEIIEVIKKYIDVDENAIDVRLTNKSNEDGTTGAPVLYANIPIVSVKEEAKEEARKIKNEKDSIENKNKINNEDENNAILNSKVIENVNDLNNETNNEEEQEETDAAKVVIEKAEEIVEEVNVETNEEKVDNEN